MDVALAVSEPPRHRSLRAKDVIDARYAADLADARTVGIDIGSRQAKAVLLANGEVFTAITASEVDQQETADRLVKRLHEASGLSVKEIAYAVSTGYGRISLSFPDYGSSCITEISCHAMGAHVLDPSTQTIIDIGGQDSKAIRIDPESGRVHEFVMNDKCAAGIHFASARRVRNLVNRVGLQPKLVFTGGVSKNLGMKQALEEVIGHSISQGKMDMVFAGALGAAALAQRIVSGTGAGV
jgi:activator of 2-hydroxyglutaryl-CoA dehydratase